MGGAGLAFNVMNGYTWYKNGRRFVGSRDIKRNNVNMITKEYFDEYIHTRQFYEGDLFLRDMGITDLGLLDTIGGNLNLEHTKITSLGNLEFVGGYLSLEGTNNLTDLGNLRTVGGGVYCTIGTSTHELLKESGLFADRLSVCPDFSK